MPASSAWEWVAWASFWTCGAASLLLEKAPTLLRARPQRSCGALPSLIVWVPQKLPWPPCSRGSALGALWVCQPLLSDHSAWMAKGHLDQPQSLWWMLYPAWGMAMEAWGFLLSPFRPCHPHRGPPPTTTASCSHPLGLLSAVWDVCTHTHTHNLQLFPEQGQEGRYGVKVIHLYLYLKTIN